MAESMISKPYRTRLYLQQPEPLLEKLSFYQKKSQILLKSAILKNFDENVVLSHLHGFRGRSLNFKRYFIGFVSRQIFDGMTHIQCRI